MRERKRVKKKRSRRWLSCPVSDKIWRRRFLFPSLSYSFMSVAAVNKGVEEEGKKKKKKTVRRGMHSFLHLTRSRFFFFFISNPFPRYSGAFNDLRLLPLPQLTYAFSLISPFWHSYHHTYTVHVTHARCILLCPGELWEEGRRHENRRSYKWEHLREGKGEYGNFQDATLTINFKGNIYSIWTISIFLLMILIFFSLHLIVSVS